jgi:hypothetical protein
MLLAAMLSLTVLMFAASPAMALDRDDRNNNHRSISHEVEQEADSGDVDQSFEVSGTGDNSNKTAGIQGTANTGNAQNQTSVFDGDGTFEGDDVFDDGGFFFRDFDGDGFDDFEFEDVGASIEVSPEQVVSSDQEVNQAASTTGQQTPT